jgi:microcystin-dependent protein
MNTERIGLNGPEQTTELSVGSIVLFAGRDIPRHWMLCDGTAVSRELYPALYRALGSNSGSGDGETTFQVPTLVGPSPNLRYIIYVGD